MKPTIIIMAILAGYGMGLWAGYNLKNSPTVPRTESKGMTPETTEVSPTEGAVMFRVTAYCPCEKCCGEWSDGFFADNSPAVGLAVAAPDEFEFGEMLDIPGYGQAMVRDRGGAIKGNRLDVFFPTHQEALEWGVQWFELEIK